MKNRTILYIDLAIFLLSFLGFTAIGCNWTYEIGKNHGLMRNYTRAVIKGFDGSYEDFLNSKYLIDVEYGLGIAVVIAAASLLILYLIKLIIWALRHRRHAFVYRLAAWLDKKSSLRS